jgi:hypothetical protein
MVSGPTDKLTGAVRRPMQRVLGILLDETTGRILVQDARQQGLIRNALLEGRQEALSTRRPSCSP